MFAICVMSTTITTYHCIDVCNLFMLHVRRTVSVVVLIDYERSLKRVELENWRVSILSCLGSLLFADD